MRRAILALALAFSAAAPLHAQRARVHEVPPRPALWAGADTNSARAYIGHGMTKLEDRPADAAAAFYWAHRLDPSLAEALYGRRVALLMSDRRRLVRYMDGDRGTVRSPEVQAIDSLQLRALMLDPFLVLTFDKQLFLAYVREAMEQDSEQATGGRNAAAVNYLINNWLAGAGPSWKAWFAFTQGQFGLALPEYERALRRAGRDEKPRLRADVARIHYFMGSYPQALEAFATAIAESKQREARDLVYVYESKALLEHSIGMIHEKQGNAAGAREAYGRALQEDLAYAPAHVRLAQLALAAGDTATAVSEMDLAVQIAPNEGALHHAYGLLLVRVGQVEEGAAALAKAAELEPYFAAPRLLLGRLYDQSGMPEEALAHYRAYLERAAKDDPARAPTAARVTALDNQLKAEAAAPAASTAP